MLTIKKRQPDLDTTGIFWILYINFLDKYQLTPEQIDEKTFLLLHSVGALNDTMQLTFSVNIKPTTT